MNTEMLYRYRILKRASPQAAPAFNDCFFYHHQDFPDGTSAFGPGDHYDLRGNFENYTGKVNFSGKSVIDIGTATGYLAFSAEEAGASSVLAFETPSLLYQQRVPIVDCLWHTDKLAWVRENDSSQQRLLNSFWYSWHKRQSKVQVCYGSLDDLFFTSENFDYVIAGALIEHLSDPITAIGHFARLATEKVIIAFTPAHTEPGEYMRPLVPWTASTAYVWWVISVDLYNKVFTNLGFETEWHSVEAIFVENGIPVKVPRFTLVATRKH